MAGWRKAWLSVMDRGGGGGSSSALLGLLSPSSSSSSLAGYKRGGAGGRYYGGGCLSSKAALTCFSAALVLAFFYVSVTNGPTANDSFPSPTASSSSRAVLSWLAANANASSTLPRKSLPPHPPIPPTASSARNATVRPRRAQARSDEEDSSAPADDLPKPAAPMPEQAAGNATAGELASNDTTPQEPQHEAVTPMPRWRRADGHEHRTRRRREITVLEAQGAATAAAAAVGVGRGDNRVVWTSGVRKLVAFARCDVYSGGWVRDESYPFYPAGSCPHIDDDFNCHKNGRPDSAFLKWRWQPRDCDIPRLNATDFLERLRGQRIIFVGDSLNRNMWESLVCILRHGVKDKKSIYEASGRNQFKTRGYYSFKFRDYNCSVDFIRSIFLVKELVRETKKGVVIDTKLRLDELDAATPAYRTADIVVFNTGHWWTHSKTSRGLNYYQEGSHVYPSLDVMDAFKKGLNTWARWIDKNIDSRRTQVVFRGYSLTHFRGGQWNSGGRCHRETEPIFNQTYLTEYPEKMRILEQVLRQMKTPVIYLNISTLTDYRKDGHPSLYRVRYDTEEERMAAVAKQDCSHWCLPGVPDTWNELLYASLLQAGKGSWRL